MNWFASLNFFNSKKTVEKIVVVGGDASTAFGVFLPVEIGALIFSFLSPFDVVKLALVNRSWNSLANSPLLWQIHLKSLGVEKSTAIMDKEYFKKKFAEINSEFIKSPFKVSEPST